jgi:hypothetical protein
MSLSVIGAGFGRTGTVTMKAALEQLGFGPCYHMSEVLYDPAAPAYWEAAADGQPVDWNKVFAGYRATVDFPACIFYRELAEAFPDAKVILTVRDPEAWFNSTQATVFNDEVRRKLALIAAEKNPGHTRMATKIVVGRFEGDIHNRERLIRTFNEHNEEVRKTIPPERLLVYEVSEGWEPLCAFLKVPVPPRPMPNENSSERFGASVDKLVFRGGAEP